MTRRSFLERCSKTVKIFMRARYHENGISQFCPQEMFDRMDLMWDEIRELYVPELFKNNDDNYKVANMRADALVKFNSSVKLVNTEPPPDSWLYRTRAAEHYTLMSSFIAMKEHKMEVGRVVIK